MPAVNVSVTLIEGHLGTGKTTTGVAHLVDAYKKDDTLRVFSNMHLYGIKYVYNPDMQATAKLLSNPAFTHGKWLIDESYIGGDARRAMSTSNLVLSWILQQARKRDLEIIYIVQHPRMSDWRFIWAANKRIECIEYDWDDEKNRGTRNIKCIIKDLKKRTEKTVRFYAPQYWPYFNTDELPVIPDKILAKV